MAGAIAAGGRAGHAVPLGVAASQRLRRTLADWAAAEVTPGRLMPWLSVAFGAGIAIYFTANREPAWWAASAVAVATLAVVVAARRHPVGFPLALGAAAIACGFAVATLQTLRIDHPVMNIATWQAQVTGYVEAREERERSDRVVVQIDRFAAPRVAAKPQRVRVSVRKDTAPPVGAYVSFKAHLAPPLAPLRPGGYDFARDMYFQQIGGSGFVLGKITTSAAPAPASARLAFAAAIDAMREGINRRIHAVLPGDRGSIASALITGKRNAISAPVADAFYVSSLAHVLAISGYHMAVVAGIVFFVLRAGLALVPALALRRPIKKWAAMAAMAGASFYLVLSGASVSTQRAYIMIAIVLIGVMLDRPTLTFRTLTVAAFGVLLIAPQSLLHPSFQMSFSATLALIAIYQYSLNWHASADSSIAMRLALWGGREVAGLLLASFVAGLATEPYAAYHFHRVAPYGVIANLLAMPVVSVLVMPMGILGVLTMPLGLDGVFWRLMGIGIDWMIDVVVWVAHLPGAVGHMAAFGTGPLLLATAGLLLICLLRSPLRWSGAVLAVAATLWAINTPRPDVLIAADGATAAIRGPQGRLVFLEIARDNFAAKEWLTADGDARLATDAAVQAGVRCDAIGCTGRLRDGRIVAFARSAEAFEDDCQRAAVVLSAQQAPADCATLVVVDRPRWQRDGATALYANGDRFRTEIARPPTGDRPWARAPAIAGERGSPARHRTVPEATPKAEDMEAGD
ncbi:MAG: ComEC family competence protein [Proteobacteria bacterium]|nr:ComEC family competence protein [Pseudomonadota bacterium]